MKLKKMHILGIVLGAIILLASIFFYSNINLFIFLVGIAVGLIALPFVIDVILESGKSIEINEMFLEFSRNLAESVKSGTPVSKSIINLKNRNYGALSPFVEKLANQIAIGIPVSKSLDTFAYEINKPVITRAITLIREAEKAGGEIEYILESSAKSIAEIEKLKNERKAVISNLVVQGYLIFFIFIGIMLVMEFKILPMTSSLSAINLDMGNLDIEKLSKVSYTGDTSSNPVNDEVFSSFLTLLLVQGFFAGLIIGKITEGTLKSGIKHAFILLMATLLISTGARLFF
ncbi:MAG: type II secretion system F family protein [Nanoarchaeota archaeon]